MCSSTSLRFSGFPCKVFYQDLCLLIFLCPSGPGCQSQESNPRSNLQDQEGCPLLALWRRLSPVGGNHRGVSVYHELPSSGIKPDYRGYWGRGVRS